MRPLSTGICMVRARLAPYEQGVHMRLDTKAVRMLVYGPNTPRLAVVQNVTRVESTLTTFSPDRTSIDEHLIADPAEADPSWLSLADVIVVGNRNANAAHYSLADVSAQFPGCLVMALDHPSRGLLVQTGTGWRIQLVRWPDACSADDVPLCASLVHTWMVAGRPLAALEAARVVVWSCQERDAAARYSRFSVACVTG